MTSVIGAGNLVRNIRSGEVGEILRVDGATATLRTPSGREVDRLLSNFVTITDRAEYRHVGIQLIVGG